LTYPEHIHRAVESYGASAEKSFNAGIVAAPAAVRPQMKAAFDAALAETMDRVATEMSDHVVEGLASRLTDAQVAMALELADSDLGRKMVTHPDQITPEERQQLGKFFLDHPGYFAVQSAQLQTGLMTYLPDHKSEIGAELITRYCGKLGRLKQGVPACSRPKPVR
jgi:hypothetical protein